MSAFSNAVAMGVHALEMDVHATSDGRLVVLHDPSVDRTTDGTGEVRRLSFAEVSRLDAGEGGEFQGQGERIPEFEEVLTAFPDTPIIVDIKQSEPSIVEPFGLVLRRHGRERNTIVASFHPGELAKFRSLFPQFATAASSREVLRFIVLGAAAWRGNPPMTAFEVPAKPGSLRVVSPRFLRNAARVDIPTHVWTVNDVSEATRLKDMGVQGVITDRPDLMLPVWRG
jgi:glycerophosphoryl diester phosphodiesterase